MAFMRRVVARGDAFDRRVRALMGMRVRLSSLTWDAAGLVVRDGGRATPRNALRLEPGGMRVLTGPNAGGVFGWDTWAPIAPVGTEQ